jgi:hypothetical protein
VRWLTLIALLAPSAVAQDAPPEKAAEAAPAQAAAPAVPRTMGTLILKSGATGADVAIDGVVIGAVPLPGPWTLPPGPHKVEVRPASGEPAKAAVEITAGEATTLKLFEKAEAVVVVPERVVTEKPVGPGFSMATAGYVTAGVGLALVGAGVFFGLDASSTADDANAYDTANPEHTRAGLQALVDDSEQSAFQANVALGIGGAAMLAGAAMLWLASDGPFRPRRVTARPVANGALLRWTF